MCSLVLEYVHKMSWCSLTMARTANISQVKTKICVVAWWCFVVWRCSPAMARLKCILFFWIRVDVWRMHEPLQTEALQRLFISVADLITLSYILPATIDPDIAEVTMIKICNIQRNSVPRGVLRCSIVIQKIFCTVAVTPCLAANTCNCTEREIEYSETAPNALSHELQYMFFVLVVQLQKNKFPRAL